MMKRKLILVTVLLLLVSGFTFTSYAEEMNIIERPNYQCDVDNNLLEGTPLEVNERIFLPIRFLFEELGFKVVWDAGAPDDIVIQNVDKSGNVVVYKMTIGKKELYKNNELVKMMDVAPFVHNDRTYAPVRFVPELMGYKVEWITSENRAHITTK